MERETGRYEAGLLLDRLCVAKQAIPALGEHITLYPGFELWTKAEGPRLPIEGRYGLVQFLDETYTVPVARAGFSLKNTDILLTNSPQGFTRDTLSMASAEQIQAVMQKLKEGTFRDDLLVSLITFAGAFTSVGIERIRAVSAEHHDKVDRNGGPLAYDHALLSMDRLYERHGFRLDESGDYQLPLRSLGSG